MDTRRCWKIHRTVGAMLFVFFFALACTGLLLGWKKHSGGIILPKSYQGISTNKEDWLPIHTLHERAVDVMKEHAPAFRTNSIRLHQAE